MDLVGVAQIFAQDAREEKSDAAVLWNSTSA
jgi:hypothetical protein